MPPVPVPFDYNELRALAFRRDPDTGVRSFPRFDDDGGDLALVLRDLRYTWEAGDIDAAVAALAILALLDARGAR